jgi:type I restriction-modification system DNA methylase subunit
VSQLFQLSLSEAASHHNQHLFSDYFLDHILPNEEPWHEEWQRLHEEAAPLMAQLQQLYARFVPGSNEAQTEDDWIKPILTALGHTFEVQALLKTPDGTKRPDYIFYRDDDTRLAHKNTLLSDALPRMGAFAVGDAKAWDRPLDQTLRTSAGTSHRGGDPFTNKNPSFQIFFYMLHSALPWGILTNGRLWRLYAAQSAHKLDIYYEVDLPALLDANDIEKFLYFYAFFRRAAFEQGMGVLTLEHILNASAEYARGVSESLRSQVYDALRYVAQAFIDYPDNHLTLEPEMRKLIYDNSLILLYRLLFILYAEARDLLPLQDNKMYRRRYSLDAIKKDVARELEEGLILPMSGTYWTRLRDLFRYINAGNPPLNVTIFNGGLFDPRRHEFLERCTAGDLNLCRAIDKLARVNRQFVDFRDLAERHLGTIYEGLLEYTLHVASEPMAELRSSSKIVPLHEAAQKDIAHIFDTGDVYLATDLGERKLTGSYYTPDFIVKYMVDEALRPVLEKAVSAAQTDDERITSVLSVNVLDPSMGSGHFPVEVTEYIARYLVELGVQPEGTDEADLTYWKRRVAQQCIYGVDLNPLAVELAKLSLWLNTAAKDRPLSFLDHHLRPGNALVGSWLSEIAAGQHPGAAHSARKVRLNEEAAKYAGQLPLLDDADFRRHTSEALASIRAIEHSPGVTIKDIKAQEAAYEALRQQFSEQYLPLANLGVALYYDLAVPDEQWRSLADYALGRAVDNVDPDQFESWLDRADQLARRKHIFHWELEFPDIFFDEQGLPLGARAGFDVVIGNPPYVRQEQLSADKPYLREHYEVYHGVADLFVYFFAQGLRLLRQGGHLTYISSNAWLRAEYATPLRRHIRTQTVVETIIDLGDNRVFADAPDLTPSIQVVSKTAPITEYKAQAAVFARGEGIRSFREQLDDKLFALTIHDQPDDGWQLSSEALRSLFTKLMKIGKPLRGVVNNQLYRGAVTGLNEVFVVNKATRDQLVLEDPECTSLIKPILRGEDLRPWYQENEELWLIFTKHGIDINAYPSILTYLQRFREQLEPRSKEQKETHTQNGRKPGSYKWYEIQDSAEYYELFNQPKIFWPSIGKFPRFSWDEQGFFVNSKGYVLLPTGISLLGILQSRVIWFCIINHCQPLGERAGLVRYQQNRQKIIDLPIPPLPNEQKERIGGLARQLTETAQRRYEARRRMAHRILSDLGTGASTARLNQRLEAWWELPFQEFRAEVTRTFKRDIPLKDRDNWEQLLRDRAAEIDQLTREIHALETRLNAEVYAAFALTDDEIALIEQETKYAYGEW